MIPIRDSVFCRSTPYAVITLIVLNALVFLHMQGLQGLDARRFVVEWGLLPILFSPPEGVRIPPLGLGHYATFVTYTVLHGGWLHLIFNLWTLWLFGCALESRLGTLRFVLFYLACGIGAGVVHVWFNPGSPVPVIGASGAVAGVIAAYAWSYPRAEILLLIPIVIFPLFIEVPAMLFAALWFGLQIMQGSAELLQPAMGGSIAWWAHAGGFVVGIVVLQLLAPRDRKPLPWDHRRKR
ncbi:MAG: rhomboid family intramembrane serine protease [Geminicoccaceae bacterium]|nr:MAG: rhomboid family intramembrane serine protease [Geminicoccaceae bacterium]